MDFSLRADEMTRVGHLAAVLATALPLAGLPDYVPDGREWQDHTRRSFGTLAPRAVFGSFPDVASARQVLSSLSPRTVSLDGEAEWRFRWSRRPSERPQGFERPGYDVSDWPVVKVPCSWQAMGIRASGERFGTPIYVNQQYIFTPPFPENTNCWPRVLGNRLPAGWTFSPDDNPVGSYRRQFTVPRDWDGDRIVLRFDGVESFFYVWVNGHCLGFAKDSRAVSEFDVTDVVRNGDNTLAVEVYRNSDGSYLECHDVYRLSGIHRSVYLTHVPKTHLRDVALSVAPLCAGDCGGKWAVDVAADVAGPGPGRLTAHVFAPCGAAAQFEGGLFDERGRARLVFDSPELWNAEVPSLYTLVVALEIDGRVVEAAGFDLGFRESRICGDGAGRVYQLNGRPIKLKGVNRGETDPMYGHHVPNARLEQDLELIKRGNFNFVRNSHFPQPERFYYLANRLGLYVMDEANIESHGFRYGPESLSHEPSWFAAHLGRVRSMYERSKNQPCVVFWSLGNEAGPGENFKECSEWLRMRDGSRPIHYERNNAVADMGSCFYPTLELARNIANADGKVRLTDKSVVYPFLFVEYAHNLNNNCGNLGDFQRIFESHERVMGGALWDFADQALWKKSPAGKTVAAWGGCFGEKPEEGQGIMDGIVTCDRRPEPGYYEAKYVFQPFAARLAEGCGGIEIENKHDFVDSSGYDIKYIVMTNGVSMSRGCHRLVIAPHAKMTIPLPDSAKDAMSSFDGEVAVRLDFVARESRACIPAGFVVAEEQITIASGTSRFWGQAPQNLGTSPMITDGNEVLRVENGKFSFCFSKETGELASLGRGGRELLLLPMTLDAFRVPVGGETHLFAGSPCFGRLRMMDGLRDMRPGLCRLEHSWREGEVIVETEIAYRGVRKEDMPEWGHGDTAKIVDLGPLEQDAPRIVAKTKWTFRSGCVNMKTTFRQTGRTAELQRIGWRLVFATPRTDICYFACGPRDNYIDRKGGCFPAVYTQPSDSFGFAYGCSQDGGNREDARFVYLKKPGIGFASCGGRRFAFSVSPYSPTELLNQCHPELLPRPVKTEVGLYAKVRGLGSGNCGPEPKAEDRLPSGGTFTLDVDWH